MSIKSLIKHLNPQRSFPPQRFSPLLLEHGEKVLQDWAVVAYSKAMEDGSASTAPVRSQDVHWEHAPQRGASHTASSSTRTHPRTRRTSGYHYPSTKMTKIEGRLHLCSKSVVFEPHEPTRPILRCPFGKMDACPGPYPPIDASFGALSVDFISSKHVVLKENNTVGPFDTVPVRTHFSFTFLHSAPTCYLETCQQLWDGTYQEPEVAPFDLVHLVYVREEPITPPMAATLLTPLSRNPTQSLLLTKERIYFGTTQHWLQRNVVATARRYQGLRDAALELYWKDGSSTLFGLQGRHDRELVLRSITANVPCVTDRSFVVRLVEAWHAGQIDNFEYLLGLNSAAGRTFHDLSRYPVFPWVISDYESAKLDLESASTFRDLSKPIGALDEERLDYFRNRMESMHDMGDPFLYGTHYSTPGYVLYYLVRSMPEHMLCLQNGKFDAPDRMFHSVLQCFKCVLTNHADVKELLPEFYDTSNSFDWLINVRGLQLGATQNGERVDDVSLPPWARSARDFVKKNRKALESKKCTDMLPQWIDLVFGVKSRGEEARLADNLFHPITYLGPNELAHMQTEEERTRAVLQATEFGIVPDLLFEWEHPRRGASHTSPMDLVSKTLGRAPSKDEGETSGKEAWELLETPAASDFDVHRANPALRLSESMDGKSAIGTSSSFKGTTVVPRADAGTTEERNATQPAASAPAMEALPLTTLTEAASTDSVHQDVSGWNLKPVDKKRIHTDGVSASELLVDDKGKTLLVTTSLDGGLMVHTISNDAPTPIVDADPLTEKAFPSLSRFTNTYSTILNRANLGTTQQSKLVEFRNHATRDPLASLALALDDTGGYVAFAGGHDDVVLAYGVNSGCALASVYSHRDAVTGLSLIARTPFDAESALWLENSTHILVSGSWDATCKIWSVTLKSGEAVAVCRDPIAELFDASSSIGCVSAIAIPGGGIVIAAGCADGTFSVWNVHSDGVQVLVHGEPAARGSGPCSSVKWISENGVLQLVAAFSSGKVAVFSISGTKLERTSAVSVGVAVLSLNYAKSIVLAGCSDGGLRLLPLGRDGSFGGPPTLWPEAVNKESSGITSVSVTTNPKDQGYMCCCGGEDGSIALFELKRAVK